MSNSSYFMGAIHYSLNPHLEKLLHTPQDQIAQKELQTIKESIVQSGDQKIVSALISSSSFDISLEFLSSLDQMLRELQNELKTQGFESEIILISNLGQTNKNLSAIDLNSALAKSKLQLSSRLLTANDVASPALTSHNVALLYFKDISQREKFIYSLQNESWYSQAIYLAEKDSQHFLIKIFDKNSKAELLVLRKPEGYQFLYKIDGEGNPLNLPEKFQGNVISSDLALRLSLETSYPDSFFRLAQLAEESEFAMPDLIVTANQNFTFSESTLDQTAATSGGLSKENSIAFISSNDETRILPAVVRTKDILNTLQIPAAKLFKNKVPFTSQNLFFDFIHYSRYVLDLSSLQVLFDIYQRADQKGNNAILSMNDFDFKKIKRETDITFRGMNKNEKANSHSEKVVRMIASDDKASEPTLLLKNYTSLYVMERAISRPLLSDIVDNRDFKKASFWNTHREELLADRPKLKEFAAKLFSEIYNERLLTYNSFPNVISPLYNRLSEDRDDITFVYIPGIYNAIFEGKIFTIGLDGLRNNFGVRVISPPVFSTCSSKYNGGLILKFIKDDIAYRAERKQKKQKYFLMGYSKGGLDSLGAFVQDKEFVKKEILGLLTLASPLHGASILKRADIPLPIFDVLTTESIPEICKKTERASKSITPEGVEIFFKEHQKDLIDLTRYYSLSFHAKPKGAHYWMKAAKMIAMYKEDNDGVVTLSSSHFPDEFDAINLGVVNADHLAGLIETNFPQEAFFEAIYYTLLELKAFDEKPLKK